MCKPFSSASLMTSRDKWMRWLFNIRRPGLRLEVESVVGLLETYHYTSNPMDYQNLDFQLELDASYVPC